MLLVPSVSVGKLRRAFVNGNPSDHVLLTGSYTSTSLDGLGATLPPPITYIRLQKVSPRVSPVAPCGWGDRRDRAGGVTRRVKAKGVGGVDYRPTLVIRCASHVDDSIYGARRRIHDPLRRVRHLGPLGSYPLSRIKLPDLIRGAYVDVEPAQDV